MRDFTFKKLRELLYEIEKSKTPVIKVRDYLEDEFKHHNYIILRHDVDKNPEHSLKLAAEENHFGIAGTYYFRKKTFNPTIVKSIYALGHEIGYHFEDLATNHGDHRIAIKSFESNLKLMREIVPIETICMHGSPLSNFNNIHLLKYIDCNDNKLLGEVYNSIDFNNVFYYTDSGRAWNSNSNLRDHVQKNHFPHIRSTEELISKIKSQELPPKAMICLHPQRWHDNTLNWTVELIAQSIKNQVKYLLKNIRNE